MVCLHGKTTARVHRIHLMWYVSQLCCSCEMKYHYDTNANRRAVSRLHLSFVVSWTSCWSLWCGLETLCLYWCYGLYIVRRSLCCCCYWRLGQLSRRLHRDSYKLVWILGVWRHAVEREIERPPVCQFPTEVEALCFIQSPTDRCVGSIIFSGCLSVSASVRASVRMLVLLAWYLTNQWMAFHHILIDDVVEGTDELSRFWRSWSQKSRRGQIFEWVIPAGMKHTHLQLGVKVSSSV